MQHLARSPCFLPAIFRVLSPAPHLRSASLSACCSRFAYLHYQRNHFSKHSVFFLAAAVQPYRLQDQDSGSGEETSSGEDDMSEGSPMRMIGSSAEGVPVGKHAQEGPYREAARQDIVPGTLSPVLYISPYSLSSHARTSCTSEGPIKVVATLFDSSVQKADQRHDLQKVALSVQQYLMTGLWAARGLQLALKRSLRQTWTSLKVGIIAGLPSSSTFAS